MNEALNGVIEDLKKQVESNQSDVEWYAKKLKEFELKIINLKETIAELEAMKSVMA